MLHWRWKGNLPLGRGGTYCPWTAYDLFCHILTVLVAHAERGHKRLLTHDCFPPLFANCGAEGKGRRLGICAGGSTNQVKCRRGVTVLAGPEIKIGCGSASSCTSAADTFTPEQISASTSCYLSQASV